MPNISCLAGPPFSISGDSYFISNAVTFQVVFNNTTDQESVLAFEWYLDDFLIINANTRLFSGSINCGDHRIGVRILSSAGWSGVQYATFNTCKVPTSKVIQGPDIVQEGSSAQYQVAQLFSDGSATDISNLYHFSSSPSGSFSGNIFQSVQDDQSQANIAVTISATDADGNIITKNITVMNTTQATHASILVVDFYNNTNLDIIGFIDHAQVSVNHAAAYTGNNIIPASALPANAYILASDLNHDAVNWRFEFNLAKLMADYPGISDFSFYIKGRGNAETNIDGAFSLKTNGATLVMNGSTGTYMPSVINGSTIGQLTNFSSYILPGANGSHAEADLNEVIIFNYHVPNDTLTYSIPTRSYSSKMISEEVQRNNCASGFEGSKVVYTLASGAYTSAISQADADQQARNFYDSHKQQYANENGTCIALPDYHFKSSTSGSYPVTMTTGYSSGDCAMQQAFNGSMNNQSVVVDQTGNSTNLVGWGGNVRMFKVPIAGTYRVKARLTGNIVCNDVGGDADHQQTISFLFTRTGGAETNLIAPGQNNAGDFSAAQFCLPGQYVISKGMTLPIDINFSMDFNMVANEEANFRTRINLFTYFNQQQGANETNTTNFNFSLLELEIEKL